MVEYLRAFFFFFYFFLFGGGGFLPLPFTLLRFGARYPGLGGGLID